MKSHTSHFGWMELLLSGAVPLLCLVAFSLSVRFGSAVRALPAPRPILDTDSTILIHQAEASRQTQSADLVLIGDSSCLMDVSAPQLAADLGGGHRVLNLATLSYVNLAEHARLLRNYTKANPGRLRTVLLLMHPQSLRLASRNPYFDAVIEHYLAGQDYCSPAQSQWSCWLGVPNFQGRIVSRAVPAALPGVYGQFYGFSWDLWDFLSAHGGSAVDPHLYRPDEANGSAEVRLAPQLEKPSRAFRESLPPNLRLITGLTPSPDSFVLRTHAGDCRRVLQEWSQWLQADGSVETWYSESDRLFSSSAHLNQEGATAYTQAISGQLKSMLNRVEP